MPTLQRIHPPGGRSTPQEIARELEFAALAPPDRPYLVLNMVSTADGKVVLDGRSGGIGDDADRALFHALRTRVDAVMMGAGTLRAERYGRLVRDAGRRAERERAGLDPDPLAIVVSARLALSPDLPLFAAEGQRVVVLTSAEAELEAAADIHYLRAPDGRLELGPLLRRLREEHGVRSILCEGGPTLNASLLHEGLVDELFLSLAPKLAGGSHPLTAVAGEPLPEPAGMELAWSYIGESSLFLRYRLPRR
ncbi:MAG: dihydrofolate reductase family protein [Thermoleophilaceae bacterium]